MKNYDLMDETVDYIEAFPEDWDQGEWVAPCGTALCFAGNAALLAHPTYMLELDDSYNLTGNLLNRKRERVGFISEVAERDLGLDGWEADDLFNGSNSLSQIKQIIAGWKKEDGVA
jgi:hypothetical protein